MFNKKNSESDLLNKRMKGCALFSSLSNSEIKTLLSIAHIRNYSEGEKIFNEGTLGLCFYIIVKGSAEIISEKRGETGILKKFNEGDYFSEVHLFSESHHTVSCVAAEVTELIIFAKPDFEDLVKIKSQLGNKILLKFLEFFGMRLEELYKENRELKLKLNKAQAE